MNIACFVCGLCWSTLFASFSNSVTSHISAIGFTIYNCSWLNYPAELQKYMILMIARSQKPAHLTGLKLFPCTLEMFGKVSENSFFLTSNEIFT